MTVWTPEFAVRRAFAVAALSLACAHCDGATDAPAPAGDDFYDQFLGADGALVGKGDAVAVAQLPIQLQPLWSGTFDQEIDHALGPDGTPAPSIGTFKQRIWASYEFMRSNDAPILFYFCGEAECSPAEVAGLADVAKSMNAGIVGLEHRYYGQSIPLRPLTADHMKYLTIHNALEDAAAVERYVKSWGWTGKWIAVGGSYAGALAAFYREKHPELVVGAWASSAPVDIQLAFWGYDAIAAKDLGPVCSGLFREALAAAGNAYADPARRDVLAPKLVGYVPANVSDFLVGVAAIAQSAAQYGAVAPLCAALAQESESPLDGLLQYLAPPTVTEDCFLDSDCPTGSACIDGVCGVRPPQADPGSGSGSGSSDASGSGSGSGSSHASGSGSGSGDGAVTSTETVVPGPSDRMPLLREPAVLDDFTGSEWFYQVCSELGFYQIASPDRDQSILPDEATTEYWNEACVAYTGHTPAIDRTRAEYTEPILRGEVSNILFVNGSTDPWSTLSLTRPNSARPGVTTFVVQGGSHCEDLQNLQPRSLVGVFQTHKKLHDLARTWLTQ